MIALGAHLIRLRVFLFLLSAIKTRDKCFRKVENKACPRDAILPGRFAHTEPDGTWEPTTFMGLDGFGIAIRECTDDENCKSIVHHTSWREPPYTESQMCKLGAEDAEDPDPSLNVGTAIYIKGDFNSTCHIIITT